MKELNRPVLLNLAGDLGPELKQYLQTRGVEITSDSQDVRPSHILTRGLKDFSELSRKYGTNGTDIKIISLSGVPDLQNFLSHNGKLILNEQWLQGGLGTFILDKFFQEYSGISLQDSYPSFKELGSFNVVNPFNTGEYLDRMVHGAFESGVPALSVKTYFDHLLMYLTDLKSKEKVGMPIEVIYGVFDGVFGLQSNFFAGDLTLADVTPALSSVIELHSAAHSLNVAAGSCGFFDFTYLEEVKKVVITALWSKTIDLKAPQGGLYLSSLSRPRSINQFASDGVAPFFTTETLTDLTETITRVAASPIPEEKPIVIPSGPAEEPEEVMVFSSSGEDEDEPAQVIAGEKPKKEEVQRFSGEKKTPDSPWAVKNLGNEGSALEGLQLNKPQGSLDADLIKIQKLEKENVHLLKQADAFRKQISDLKEGPVQDEGLQTAIARAVAEKEKQFADSLARNNKESDVLKSRITTMGNELMGLRESQKKLAAIRAIGEAPEAIPAGEMTPEKLVKKLRHEAEQKEAFFARELERLERLNLNKESMVEKIKETMSGAIRKRDEELQDLRRKLDQVSLRPVKSLKEIDKPDEMEFNDFGSSAASKPDRQMENQLQKSVKENDYLKGRLVEMGNELRELREELSRVQSAAASPFSAANIEKRQTAQATQETEHEVRKVQLELDHKNNALNRTMEKLEREASSKDFMMEKSRENFIGILEKKDEEIKALQIRNNELVQQNANKVQQQKLRDLERTNEGLHKTLETYKTRVNTLAAELESLKTPGTKDDIRRLQVQSDQSKNLVDSLKREITRLQERTSADNTLILTLKNEKSKLEQQLKKNGLLAKIEKPFQQLEAELKKAQQQNGLLETQLREAGLKIRDMDSKMQDALRAHRNQSDTTDGQSKSKIAHLEGTLKRLTQDLVDNRNQLAEAKKDLTKVRLEKAAIQNQLDTVKGAKKPGNGGKAA